MQRPFDNSVADGHTTKQRKKSGKGAKDKATVKNPLFVCVGIKLNRPHVAVLLALVTDHLSWVSEASVNKGARRYLGRWESFKTFYRKWFATKTASRHFDDVYSYLIKHDLIQRQLVRFYDALNNEHRNRWEFELTRDGQKFAHLLFDRVFALDRASFRQLCAVCVMLKKGEVESWQAEYLASRIKTDGVQDSLEIPTSKELAKAS